MDSEYDYRTGCRNVSRCQQQPYPGLCHPDDHIPLTHEMTIAFKPLTE